MNFNLQELKKGLELNTRKVKKYSNELSAEERFFRPYEKVNHFIWHLGHLTYVRNTFIKLLDESKPTLSLFEGEEILFGRNSVLAENAAYPAVEIILDAFENRGARISELLESVSEEWLNQESFLKFGPNYITNAEQVWFFYNHETEHLGEMKTVKNLAIRLREVQL